MPNMNADLNNKDIVDYYEHCQVDYEFGWRLNISMSMHYGYWHDDTKKLRQALLNMNKEVASFGQVKDGDYVLDAGCGVGGSSIFLAKAFGCRTQGITLSEKQVLKCRENAAAHSVSKLCQFDAQSYLSTDFADNTFDVVWAIESVCYAPDKEEFLREAFRVLKPGGHLVVADFFNNGIDKQSNRAVMLHKWARTWAIASFEDLNAFWESLDRVGFTERQKKDVSKHVEPSIIRLYIAFFLGLPLTYLFQALGIRNKIQTANVWSTYYQYHAYKKKLWKYMFFTAKKPVL